MKRLIICLSFVICHLSLSHVVAQTEVTQQEAKSLIKNTTKKRVSVHDPSVVYEPASKRYYVFGSHRGCAFSTDMKNWTNASFAWKAGTNSNAGNDKAFITPAVQKVKKGGVEVDFPQFNAMAWSAKGSSDYDINGNMWAPDVLWNPTMQKWCMYLSINGDRWYSSIILLTSDKITGPYLYQGPVVISGFYSGTNYKATDLELVLGTLTSLPARYNVGNSWGKRWPNNIDPAAFYDENGKLWLVYGSWSGGIWMLELNEETGLRDYDVTYPSTNGSSDGVTSDPYFGTKVAGGYYVSGEGPYIEHIGNYYYLFMSYGGFAPDGGYEMRVFRSENPNGPYKDAAGKSAIFTGYVMNYGTGNSDTRGEKIMGAYNNWGFMTVGECAQGHNSIIAAEDGRTYLVYHTKFNDGTIGHQVRVHQVFQNKQGWLVAAPFEYNGEAVVSADVANTETVSAENIPGTYQILIHKYKMNYAGYEEVKPVSIELNANGTVTGAYTGTWSLEAGTGYLTLKLGTITYNGVIFEEEMDTKSIHTVSFTAMATNGVNVWGYRAHPKYAVAMQLNSQTNPVHNNMQISQTVDLLAMDQGIDNVTVEWSSSEPDIITDYGRYNPTGLTENKPVTLSARVSSCNYYWAQDYQVTALSEANSQSTAAWKDGMVAHYGFDDASLTNTLNTTEQAQLKRNSTTALPKTEANDPLRNGDVVHTSFGANGKESYVSMPNPLFGKSLENGATISFWVKRTDDNLWDALFGLTNGSARFYMTGNIYLGFNEGKDDEASNNWLDINHPNTVNPTNLTVGRWHNVTITFSRNVTSSTGGINIYIDGSKKSGDRYNGKMKGVAKTTRQSYDYNLIVDHLAACPELFLGNGSFWGSPDACFDDIILYDKELKSSEMSGLIQMTNRVFDASSLVSGIQTIENGKQMADNHIFDLSGRRIKMPAKGMYIKNGKKFIIR